MDLPNLRHLRAFAEVARLKGISAAAETVHLSQPAITQAIRKLEAGLGAPLFDRRANGMFLTPLGALFAARAERTLSEIEQGASLAIRSASRAGHPRPHKGFARFDRLVTIAQLKALIALVAAQNFTIAARNIGISQPTLHRAARDLERLSGLPLFVQSSRGVTPTPAAEALARHARLALAELNQGLEEAGEHLGHDSGTIIIGTMPLARTSILPAAIDQLVRERPGVQIQAIDGPYRDLLHGLRHGEIDMLIGALRDPVPADDVVQEPVLEDTLAVIARAGHPLVGRRNITIADLMPYPFIAPPKTTPGGQYLYNMMRIGELPQTPVRIVTSSNVLVRGLLLRGDYVTVLSLHQVHHEREQGLVVPLNIAMPASTRPIGLTTRKGWRPTPAQSRFLDLVRQIGASQGPASPIED